MCNLWEREVVVYFDLHIGGNLLQPYLGGDTRGQIRSLNRQVCSPFETSFFPILFQPS